MSHLYAAFTDAAAAQAAYAALLRSGATTEDVSLVVRRLDEVLESGPPLLAENRLEDATAFVGRADDPEPTDLTDLNDPANDIRVLTESPIGGGIATDTRDDSVSGIEEMDDSQSAAEDMISPPLDRPASRHEVDDLQLTLETGFPTPVPTIDKEGELLPDDPDADLKADTLAVPGFGVVAGLGGLATACLDWADPGERDIRESLVNYLYEEGMGETQAQRYADRLHDGGALLEVTLHPDRLNPDAVRGVVEAQSPDEASEIEGRRF